MNSGLEPGLFTKERFFSVKKGDSFFNSFSEVNEKYYDILEAKYESACYVGDKVPLIYERYNDVANSLGGALFVFVFRNIFDVASSYERRKNDKNDILWGNDMDYTRAVRDWNRSLQSTIAAIGEGHKIALVAYEDFFRSPVEPNPTAFSMHGLDIDDKVNRLYERVYKKNTEIEHVREAVLSSAQKYYIMKNANFDLYTTLEKMYEEQVQTWGNAKA
jgi:hypothetical protein